MELVLAADSPGFEVNRLPRWLSGKGSACDAGGTGLMPGSGRSPGGGSGSPLVFLLENPTDRGAWGATVSGVTESQTQLNH